MDRFYVAPEAVQGEHVELGDELSHRLRHVLRLRAGDRVILFDGSGFEYEVALDGARGATVVERRVGRPEPKTRVILYQAVIKGDRFDWLLEKGTELGVARFVPLLAARRVVRPGSGRSERRERWLRIVTEAAEQCGRSRLPELDSPARLEEALGTAAGLRLFLWEREEAVSLRQTLRKAAGEAGQLERRVAVRRAGGRLHAGRSGRSGCGGSASRLSGAAHPAVGDGGNGSGGGAYVRARRAGRLA